MSNFNKSTVDSFGDEWARFDQSRLDPSEAYRRFQEYFEVFPWHLISSDAIGFDMGCGSGRWSSFLAPHVGLLHCIDPSKEALDVARSNLRSFSNVEFHLASVDNPPLPPSSQDFGVSLGVLHHVSDTEAAIKSCVSLLKPGAPLLIYLYYSFYNRPYFFKIIWKISDLIRVIVHRLPRRLKNIVTDILAIAVYLPIVSFARVCSMLGFDISNIPLSYYTQCSFYSIRTDSRDRFGTPIERRFSRADIMRICERAGLENLVFSDNEPYWCFSCTKKP